MIDKSFIKYYFLNTQRTLHQWPPLQDQENQLIYLAIGLATEANELQNAYLDWFYREDDKSKITSELGDINWHLFSLFGCIAKDKNIEIETISDTQIFINRDDRSLIDFILNKSLIVLELMKKIVYHKHDIDFDIILELLRIIFHASNKLSKSLCGSLEEVLQANIEKLKRRYPQGFSYEDSQNRKEDENEE